MTNPTPNENDTILATHALRAGYGRNMILNETSVAITQGDFAALIGPNGSGKSTLLRVLSRLLKPQSGRVLLHDQPIAKLSTRALARKMAVMPQSPTAPPGITVRELVGYGRTPHTSWLQRESNADQQLIDTLIERCDLTPLAERHVHTLSGGERQRCWIAMALAQEPTVLLLDEPVSALDIAHQLEVLDLLKQVNEEQGTTIVIVLHDINLATRYCQSLLAVRNGSVVMAGPTAKVLTADNLQAVFGVSTTIFHPPEKPYPVCLFDRP